VKKKTLIGPSPLGVAARLAATETDARAPARAELAALAERSPLALGTARALDAGSLEPEEVTLAWEIARLAAPDAQAGILTLALGVLEAVRAGSTYLPWGHVGWGEALAGERPTSEAGAWRAVGPGGSGGPLDLEGSRVALARWVAIERTIADALAERSRRAPGPDAQPAGAASGDPAASRTGSIEAQERVRALRDEPLLGPRGPVALTSEQEDAVAAMLTERTLVLSGGPGTGKTSVVVALLRALARRGDDPGAIALAAPTGKAADRLARRALRGPHDPASAPGLPAP